MSLTTWIQHNSGTDPAVIAGAAATAGLREDPPARYGGMERRRSASPALWQRLVDELDHGLLLVDAEARLHLSNRQAQRHCLRRAGLKLMHGHVACDTLADSRRLLDAVAAACNGRRSLVTLQGSGEPLPLAVIPLRPADAAGIGTDQPLALVLLPRHHTCQPLSLEFFARQHRITPAECAVLRGLCEGQTPIEVAAAAGVAVSTVRTQISSVRQKTGTRTIGDLIRLVSLLPPVMGLMN